MIQVQNISKGFGEQELLREVGFVVNKGERIGLVGRNGSGKTTLFKIILGLEHADAGQIDIPKRYTMGYLQQHLSFSAPTVLQEACSALPVQEGGWTEDWKAQEILGGLGLDEDMQNAPPAQLSGGYQIRLNLAKVLLQAPDLLMLDEPTNYLDVVSVRWLQRFLRQWPGELMIITHDRIL
jgi:ATP-binding cassette, subfamily F, member 3